MADEIIVKVRADLDGFSADMQEAKKIGNSAIQDIEKNDLFAKANANAKDLKKSLELIAKASGDIRFDNANLDEVINDSKKLKELIVSLTQSLKGMKQGTTEFNALDAIIKSANVQLTKLSVTSEATGKSLRTQMREAQLEVARLSDKFGATSKQAIEAAKNAALLRDKLGDAKALTDAFNPDAKFNALSKSITGIASGFSAVQGAMGLIGSESEDVQKTLLKVQSALALSQGLQGLGEAKDSFVQLKAVAIDAFKGIKTAIGSTGIGLLVVALGTVVAYWDDIKEAISGVSQKQRDLLKTSEDNVKSSKAKLDLLTAQEATLKLQGVSEREIIKLRLTAIRNDNIANKEKLEAVWAIEDAEAAAADKRRKALVEYLGFYGNIINSAIDGKSAIEESKLQKQRLEERKVTLAKMKGEEDKIQLQLNEIDKKANETKTANHKKYIEDKKKQDLDYAKSVYTSTQNQVSDADEIEKINDVLLSERDKVMIHYGELLLLAEKNLKDTTGIEQKLFDELEALDKKDLEEKTKKDEQIKANAKSVGTAIGDAYKRGYQTAEEYQQELIDKQKQAVNELLDFAQNGILITIGLNPNDVQRVRVSLEELKKTLDNSESTPAERAAAAAQAAGAAYQTVSNSIFAADTQRRQEELAALQGQQEEELRLAGDNEQKKEIIRQKYALKEKDIKRKQAEADKRKALFDATVNTAVATITGFVKGGPVLAAIAAALGAAQIALIAATPIPKFAKGGAVPSSDIQGMINGRPHAAGGVLIEAEGDEFLVKKSQAIKPDNRGLLEAVNMSDKEKEEYINRHYVMPALQAKESKAAQNYRHSVIEAENNLIARVSSHTLKSIHREQKNTTEAIKSLDKKDFKW